MLLYRESDTQKKEIFGNGIVKREKTKTWKNSNKNYDSEVFSFDKYLISCSSMPWMGRAKIFLQHCAIIINHIHHDRHFWNGLFLFLSIIENVLFPTFSTIFLFLAFFPHLYSLALVLFRTTNSILLNPSWAVCTEKRRKQQSGGKIWFMLHWNL